MTKHLLKLKDMKTAIKTLFATALTAIVLTSSAFASFAKDGEKNTLSLSKASGYDMILVKGNVKVYLKQAVKENIKVFTNEATDQVSVQQIGRKLVISSTASTPAEVYVSVKDLKRIDVSDEAYVKTDGDFNLSVLQVFLEGRAQANVNAKTGGLYTMIKGHSVLKLSGSTNEHILVRGEESILNVSKLTALKTSSVQPMVAAIDLDAQFAESIDMARVVFKSVK